MTNIVCPVCGVTHSGDYAFCPECGCSLKDADAVSVTMNPVSDQGVAGSLKDQVKGISQIAQKRISNVTTGISDRARLVSSRASNLVVQDKVTEAMGNLVNLMINVSRDVSKQMPSEMVSAIDLEAEVNFVAFTIGVTIDLAELNKTKSKTVVSDG